MTAATTARPRPAGKPNTGTYIRYELVRAFRNKRFMIFSLAFPLVLFYLIASPNRHQTSEGIAFPVYYMCGMLGYGTMAAVMAGGARIAQERSVGWHRQLRITPLSTRTYFATKIASGYAVAALSIVLLYLAGMSLGVRLTVPHWFEMTAYILVALIPFAVIGIGLGHLLTVETMGPALGGLTALFAILGGSWGQLAKTGFLHTVAQAVPSYWLVQAAQTGVSGKVWSTRGWIVIAVWTVLAARLTVFVYQRDTKRV